jgi:hypothetical protein
MDPDLPDRLTAAKAALLVVIARQDWANHKVGRRFQRCSGATTAVKTETFGSNG